MWLFPVKGVAVFALAVSVVSLIGCGGANGGDSGPTPTPTATPQRFSGVPNVVITASDGAAHLTWDAPTLIPATFVIEYHIYRDNRLVGTAPPSIRAFVDAPLSSVPQTVTYHKASGAALTTVTGTVLPLMPGGHAYAVTIVYESPNPFDGNGVTYHETDTGVPYFATL